MGFTVISGCFPILYSTQFAWSVYSASWIGKSQKMKNNIFMMLQRSRKPLLISMNGLLPALTLEYYANFLTTVLSYFMTMRTAIIIHTNEL
ncbi:hypothetical protein ACFW04_014699 [Cataglyphis niger]